MKSDNSIDKLLQKSSDLDMTNNVEDPSKDTSGWDEEDDKPISVNVDSTASSTVDKVDVNIQKNKNQRRAKNHQKSQHL